MGAKENSQNTRAIINRIREMMSLHNLNQGQVATKAGMEPSDLSRLLDGTKKLGPQEIEKIARALDASLEWLKSGHGDMDYRWPAEEYEEITPMEAQGRGFVLIPLYSKAGAGSEKAVLSEAPVNLLAFREDWIRGELRRNPSDLMLWTVDGDSMFPTLAPGEVLLVDRTATRVSDDAIYLVLAYEGVMVKRAQLKADGLHLLSDNLAYEKRIIPQSDLDSGVRILGRVIWDGRRY